MPQSQFAKGVVFVSGIVGIFHRDGTPVALDCLRSMTDFLAYRGPDGLGLWADREIGLGHTLLNTSLNTSGEPACQNEPIRMKSLWITADVHLDSKAELIRKLQSTGPRIEGNTCDASLILHAYGAWGPECVEHLRGDFSFAIWDSTAKTLFCARDHFGIKPFYYAEAGKAFIFSNTLNCLRQHSGVGSHLNQEAVGDFLLFGSNYNESTTTFKDIQRLPPAHSLLVSRDSMQARRYWYPPTQERIRYTRNEDYVHNFMDLLQSAVADRLPTDRTGIFLSGGLDSGAVAAVARAYSRRRGGLPALRSYTVGYDSLIPDQEGFYARQSAEHLGIPNEYLPLDNIEFFEKWDVAEYRYPEPSGDPFYARKIELYRRIALHCRVVLSGEGADNLMYFQMWPYMKELRQHREWSRLAFETAWFLWVRPLPWLGVARRVQRLFGKQDEGSRIPSWINPDFAKRTRLAERCQERSDYLGGGDRHLARPKAHASMLSRQWTGFFESDDPGVTRFPLEIRYPFLDLRIVGYLLAIPVFPWIYKKRLVRDAMLNKLPERLRQRPKTPLSVDPVKTKVRERGKSVTNLKLSPHAAEFVNPARLANSYGRMGDGEIRAYCLDKWLRGIS
jgi:asparagine synthase (glutamine-hydrolysing)